MEKQENQTNMTEYDLARAVAANSAQAMDPDKFQEMVMNMALWFSQPHRSYFMFLNNEERDYTIFNFIEPDYHEGLEELKKLILSRGKPLSIEYNHDHDYYEVWLKDLHTGEAHMYILFVCDPFIIEIGEKNYGAKKSKSN